MSNLHLIIAICFVSALCIIICLWPLTNTPTRIGQIDSGTATYISPKMGPGSAFQMIELDGTRCHRVARSSCIAIGDYCEVWFGENNTIVLR